MEESEDNMSAGDVRKLDSPSAVKKPKKRSLVERELETSLTARVTSPAIIGDRLNTSRYGRARRMRTESELIESQKMMLASIKSPGNENTPVKAQASVYRMHASNSPHKPETPKKALESNLDNQIDNIYQENISLSRFTDESRSPSPAKKFPKVYIRKDLIQKREAEETIMLIKNLFSPTKSATKSTNTPISLDHSSEKYNCKQSGLVDNTAVVKALDFDCNKKKKRENRDKRPVMSKNDLFELEAKCPYQVGDLAWARMGTFPFWPCIVTREPYSEMFVKRKLFGRVEHFIIHVAFFGDNGRRSWIVDNMVRNYLGQLEYETMREKFTSEDKKKDPKLYAAFFVSEKKQALWNNSVEEAEILMQEPKRLRIDLFNDMLLKFRASKKNQKSSKITRTDSDVSLSESLYDSLFSEDDAKTDDMERSKNKTRNKSFDVSEVVTACLDNMAAKTGITKIQRQSHMDRWLQKAKSKTPEKTQVKLPTVLPKMEKVEKSEGKPPVIPTKDDNKVTTRSKRNSATVPSQKPYRYRKSNESESKLEKIVHESSKNVTTDDCVIIEDISNSITVAGSATSSLGVISKVESVADTPEDINRNSTIINIDDNTSDTIQPLNIESTPKPVQADSELSNVVEEVKQGTLAINDVNDKKSDAFMYQTEESSKSIPCESSKADYISQDSIMVFDGDTTNSDISAQANTEKSNPDKNYQDSVMVIDGDTKNSDKAVQANGEISDSVNINEDSIMIVEGHTKNCTNSVQANTEKSDAAKICFDSITVVDTDTMNSDISVHASDEEMCHYEDNTDSAMEFDAITNFKTQMNEEKSILKSKTVSNESVEDKKVELTDDNYIIKNDNGLKGAQNVTIEASVTETKNDDTLNSQAEEGHQESKDKPRLSKNTETKVKNIDFLDENNSQSTNMAETRQVTLEQTNTSPHGKSLKLDKIENKVDKPLHNNILPEKSDLLKNVLNFYEPVMFYKSQNNLINPENNCRKNTKAILDNENNMSIDEWVNDANDVLNKSGNTESISQLNNEINFPENKSCRTISESMVTTSFNEINKSESILVSSTTNETIDKKVSEGESTSYKFDDDGTKTDFAFEVNHESSTRQYVESPTFTQLLESEEFFRDVNEKCDSLSYQDKNINQKVTEQTESINDPKNKSQYTFDNETADQNINENFENEDTSDEEPSPEYESLDEDITEDFRKHMMSIERNITDKKNEELLVKICNEIAEKAKLSPTKYSMDLDVAKPNDKLDTRLKGKLETTNEIQNKCKVSRKEEQRPVVVDNRKSSDLKTVTISDTSEFHNRHNKESEMANGGASVENVTDETKIIYRTRLSINNVTKERVDPNIKDESSEIKQLRKSCEYEPKVLIIPLERDKSGFLKATDIKPKLLGEDKSTNKLFKPRLSLKRDSPKSNPAETKSIENFEAVVKLVESKEVKSELAVKEKETVTLNKVPKKLNIENGAIETKIPEAIKVNGYHHIVDRKYTDTPDLMNDTDFDIDEVSLNSEDSEISSTTSIDCVLRRNLRSRPERTLENALKNPEFLKYLELRQDYLMDLHPELNPDEVVSYVYKTWQYEEDLKSDIKKVDAGHHLNLVKGIKQETPSRKKSKKSEPQNNIENYFREKYEKCRNTFDFDSETGSATTDSEAFHTRKTPLKSPDGTTLHTSQDKIEEVTAKLKKRSSSPGSVDLASDNSNDVFLVKEIHKDLDTVSIKSEGILTPKRTLRSKAITPKILEKHIDDIEDKSTSDRKKKKEREFDTDSINSEDSEVPLRQLRSKVMKEIKMDKEYTPEKKLTLISESNPFTLEAEVKEEAVETTPTVSANEPLLKQKKKQPDKKSLEDPEFIKFLELRQDALMDENPQLTHDQIVSYMHKTWLYEENCKSNLKKNDELEQANIVKGLNNEKTPPKKVRRKPKIEKQIEVEVAAKEKPRRKTVHPYYNENFSEIEDELDVFEIFKTNKSARTVVTKAETEKDEIQSPNTKSGRELEYPKVTPKTEETVATEYVNTHPIKEEIVEIEVEQHEVEYVDEIELYFTELTKPKPNVFKGVIREKICDICELAGNLVKCKGCNGMFHTDCVNKETKAIYNEASISLKGRKKKIKMGLRGRKPKSLEDSESQSDEKSQDVSADISVEDIVPPEICTFDADTFEEQLAVKMKELLDTANCDTYYDSYSSDDGIDWKDTVAGKCEIVDVKLKPRTAPIDYSNFKCNNCQKYDVPVCFVCRSAVSKTDVKMRQKCHVAHCHKYYHLECLDHWPQTQFNSGEPSRNNKKINEFFEALTCPRHVCHTCVCDNPRGCNTRFSGDKLAKCVRCPATYHSFNKCLPAGSKILTASHIICPRHSDDRLVKVPCHVNTGWCFICAQGGSLICCEYCPTSFHAECLNIKPPEGNYMCEDCETGRLPLYGEMVWVKLGHYRWWPAMILHPSEIPENIMAAKHGQLEFVVRFFGQYDHYWVNRGRVFPYQEGDSGRTSRQKSKIEAAFTTAIQHAQRAYVILKNARPNEEESLDIASSLLPPHFVKLKCNKPCGSLCGRKVEDPSLSLTQCECNPEEPDPCGPYSQCLNRMLLTECGPTCRAGDRCNNRAFEKRLYPKLEPYRTPHRGWGLRTTENIKAGQFVIEYVGELIDEEEFKRRMRRKHEIRDENFYFLTLDKERMIDAGPKGNLARFMNHCCEPNCETQKWTVLGDVRVGLFAINDIPANNEVTFNYNLQCAGIEKKRCLCGAKRCSGYIGAKPKQDEPQVKKGKDGKLLAKRTYKKRKIGETSINKMKPKKPVGRPPKPKELTEIEKDLLIIKQATNGVSSDESSRSQSIEDKTPNLLKRKRVSISTEEVSICNGDEPSVKKQKCEEKPSEVGD